MKTPGTDQGRIGVILLDNPMLLQDEYHLSPADQGLAGRPAGFLGHPATWGCPTTFRVARGCTGEESAAASLVAQKAMRDAARALDGRVDLITTNCAYTWFFRDAFDDVETPVLPSGMALLDVARTLSRDVVLLVSHSPTVERLLGTPPPGVRILGLEDQPEWHRFHYGTDSADNPLSQERMASELEDRIREDLGENGRPGSVVLECSGLPQFREVVRSAYGTPVFDLVSTIHSILGLELPDAEPRPAMKPADPAS